MNWKAFAVISILWLFGCGSETVRDTSTAQGAFELGLEFEEDERYEEALIQYAEVKNQHPYSRFAKEAELHIADIHFKRDAYIEAQHAYQTFKEFHPKHPRIDYVTYRLATSYFNQLPGTVDRDLTQAQNAILYYNQVITSFPNSKYVNKAIKARQETLKMLAEKVNYIAEFYFIRDFWLSAKKRYQMLLTKYPRLGYDAQALYGLTVCAHNLGEKLEVEKYLQILKQKFPKSSEYRDAKREIN